MIFILPLIAAVLTIFFALKYNAARPSYNKMTKSDLFCFLFLIPILSASIGALIGYGFDSEITNFLIGFGPKETTIEDYGKQKFFILLDSRDMIQISFFIKKADGSLEKKYFSISDTREEKGQKGIKVLKTVRKLKSTFWKKIYGDMHNKTEEILLLPEGSLDTP